MKEKIKIKEFRSGKTMGKSDFVLVEKNMEMVMIGKTRISLSK